MNTLLTILVAAMALAALVLLALAVFEFVAGVREKRAASESAPAPESEAPAPAPVPEPEPITEAAAAELKSIPPEAEPVVFGVPVRRTLEEEYAELPRQAKNWFDRIVSESESLEKARVRRSTYYITVMQGQDTIGRLRVARGEVNFDCTVVNPALKNYGKETGSKIRNKPLRFRITDEKELEAALFTLRLANQTSLEARTRRRGGNEA